MIPKLILLLFTCGLPSPLVADGGLTAIISATAAVVSAGSSLIGNTISGMSAEGCNRNAVIEISNHLDTPLFGGRYFLQWGWNVVPAQPIIRAHTREATKFQKVCDTATGTSGLLYYKIGDGDEEIRFVLVFSIPYNYIHASNWFGLKFISYSDKIEKGMFDEMYNDPDWHSPKKGKKYAYAYEGKPIAVFHNDYVIVASMSNLGRSIIKIDVVKVPGGHGHRYFTK